MNKRLISIDILSALMTLFVVIGHHSFPEAPSWYTNLHSYIYSWHMPVFICISSFIISYTNNDLNTLSQDLHHSIRKSSKFFLYILGVGSLAIGALYIKSRGDMNFVDSYIKLLLYPMDSPAMFLWYIYMLILMYLLFPFLKRVPSIWLIVLIILFYFLSQIKPQRFIGIDLLCRYGVFYILGFLIYRESDRIRKIPLRLLFVFSLPFVVWSILSFMNYFDIPYYFDISVPLVITGLFALPFWWLCTKILLRFCDPILPPFIWISKNLIIIYLFQMFVIQIFHLMVHKIFDIKSCYISFVLLSSCFAIATPPLSIKATLYFIKLMPKFKFWHTRNSDQI